MQSPESTITSASGVRCPHVRSLDASAGGESEEVEAELTGTASSVVVQLSMVVGDYNGDGIVDAADYTVWRDTLGSTTALQADGDNNGVIDADDYLVWASRFGASALPSNADAIPEPSGFSILLGIYWAAMLGRR